MFKLKFKDACHGDDPYYIFRAKALSKMEPLKSSPAVQIRGKMVQMWTDFAKYGNPTPLERNGPKWEPVQKINTNAAGNDVVINTFVIDEDLRMVDAPERERTTFWRNLYKKYKSRL